MRKCMIICLLAIFCLGLPLHAFAAELDTDRPCSLDLEYTQEEFAFSGLNIAIYRVAEAYADGTFSLVAPFNAFPVNIHGITSQQEWRDVASTLVAYITAEQLQPSYTAITDATGIASFTQLPTGLYLVKGISARNDNGTYLFNDFMIYLPTPYEDGSYDYDLQAKPKCTSFTPSTTYQVVKLWKDFGMEQQRPVSVTVDIYKDGQLHQTVVLNEENGWCFSWNDPDGSGIWHVVERDVPAGYTVSVTAGQTVFTITNTNPDSPPPPPSTGDIFPVWLWALGMCVTGFVAIAMSMVGLRGKINEKQA